MTGVELERTPARRLRAPLAVLGGLAAAAAVVAVLDPNEPGHYPGCPLLAIFGVYCPGCGGLRMAHAVVHGDIGVAFGLNPLAFLLLPVGGLLWARWTVDAARGRPVRSALFTWPAFAALIGVLVLFAIVRNLPFGQAMAP